MSTEVLNDPTASTNTVSTPAEPADAAQAFDELRLEVLKTQQVLEELRPALSRPNPPDYAPSLGRISRGLSQLGAHLQAIEAHPALQFTPEGYQEAMTASCRQAASQTLQQLQETRSASFELQQRLAQLLGTVRSRKEQRRALAIAALTTFLVGLVLAPLLARLLPFQLDTRVAAVVMATDRWHAGARLMQAGNPESWDDLYRAASLWQSNRAVIEVCSRAAAKTHKEERCEISMASP